MFVTPLNFLHAQGIVGIIGGSNMADYGPLNSTNYQVSQGKSYTSFQLGVLLKTTDAPFNVGVELNYRRKSNELDFSNSFGVMNPSLVEGKFDFDYLSAVCLVEYKFKHFFINTGPYLSYLAGLNFSPDNWHVTYLPYYFPTKGEMESVVPKDCLGLAATIGGCFDIKVCELSIGIRGYLDYHQKFYTHDIGVVLIFSKKVEERKL